MNTTQYAGWNGWRTTGGDSAGYPVRVINAGKSAKDGKPILKVLLGRIIGYSGWSGTDRAEVSYAPDKVWVPADQVKPWSKYAA
jgi:hypothetical protein